MRIRLCAAVSLLASGCLIGAAAQTVYRCGSNYSEQPCADGTQVQVADPRSEAQRSQASAAARSDAKAADALEQARLKEEAKPVQVYIPPAKPSAGEDDGKVARNSNSSKPAVFKAVSGKPGKATGKKKKKKKTSKAKKSRNADSKASSGT